MARVYDEGMFWIFFLFLTAYLSAVELVPVDFISSPCPSYSIINSVDFHPHKNQFCVTFTHGNRVDIYELSSKGALDKLQTLSNPEAAFSNPQHAVFSTDGDSLVVTNWTNDTLAIYARQTNGSFSSAPISIVPFSRGLNNHKPHGMAFSPKENLLAIAFGASSYYGRAIGLFRIIKEGSCEMVDLYKDLFGIPKGITFTPDGKSLLVTFSDDHSLCVFDLLNDTLSRTPRQIIQGGGIFRPEDVKISPSGNYLAITNSDHHFVSFYPFDQASNSIASSTPLDLFQGTLIFPHGMAFSPQGNFFLITEFGPIYTSEGGDICWDPEIPPVPPKWEFIKYLSRVKCAIDILRVGARDGKSAFLCA